MVIAYTEMASAAFAAGADAGWEDYDIFTNLSVPKGSVAEILIGNKADGDEREGGVRTDGSGLNRFLDLCEAEDGGLNWVSMLVQVDASTGLIELYAEVDADIEFRCVGYFTGCTFTEAINSWGVAFSSNWVSKNLLNDYGTPAERVVQIIGGTHRTDWAFELGVRIKGSALNRFYQVNEAEDGGENYANFIVKSDADGIIEVFTGEHNTGQFYYLGYFDSGVNFTEAITNYKPGGDAGWENEDLTGDAIAPPTNSIVYFAVTHEDVDAETECGIRSNGSGLDRKYDVKEAESGDVGQIGPGMAVNVDANKILEVYCEDWDEADFYYLGYFSDAGPPPAATSLGGSVVPKMMMLLVEVGN